MLCFIAGRPGAGSRHDRDRALSGAVRAGPRGRAKWQSPSKERKLIVACSADDNDKEMCGLRGSGRSGPANAGGTDGRAAGGPCTSLLTELFHAQKPIQRIPKVKLNSSRFSNFRGDLRMSIAGKGLAPPFAGSSEGCLALS